VARTIRKQLTIVFTAAAAAVALITGIANLAGKEDMLCSTSACLKVHSSSFATAFDVPVGFYATGILFFALALHLKGKEKPFLLVLHALAGIEAYFTFIQFMFIGSLCTSCLVFCALIVLAALVATRTEVKRLVLLSSIMFFATHFVFFFPHIELKPTLIRPALADKRVEIFASPSCPHCEEALSDLRILCAQSNTQLIIRPVALSKSDMKGAVEWVCSELFHCPAQTSRRLAEKIVWDNQAEVKTLADDGLAVPVVVVYHGSEKTVFKGWDRTTAQLVQNHLGVDTGSGFAQASVFPPGHDTFTDLPGSSSNLCTEDDTGTICR